MELDEVPSYMRTTHSSSQKFRQPFEKEPKENRVWLPSGVAKSSEIFKTVYNAIPYTPPRKNNKRLSGTWSSPGVVNSTFEEIESNRPPPSPTVTRLTRRASLSTPTSPIVSNRNPIHDRPNGYVPQNTSSAKLRRQGSLMRIPSKETLEFQEKNKSIKIKRFTISKFQKFI